MTRAVQTAWTGSTIFSSIARDPDDDGDDDASDCKIVVTIHVRLLPASRKHLSSVKLNIVIVDGR
jgi:hypothetical protein